MKIHYQKYKYAAALYAAVVLSASLVIAAATKPESWQEADSPLPRVISKIKNIEVVSVTARRGEGRPAALVIEMRNNSEKAVVAVALESGDEKDASGVTRNGFDGEEQPETVIEPYGTITMEMPLSYVRPGQPVRVAGVIYADDTEDGDKATRATMRHQIKMRKAKGKKGANP